MTTLWLRDTTNNGITGTGDGILYDMVDVQGAASATSVTNTTASGTEIQLTDTAGGSTLAWISGRAPSGGFTLTSTDIWINALESSMNANVGGRYRVFKRTSAGVLTELGGGPFNDGVEFATALTTMTWSGNVTDTAFAEDDRILLRVYLTNVGTMASGFTATIDFGGTGAFDAHFNIAETVSFKAESAGADLTLSKTLGAATSAATATVDVSASLAKTLGALTSSARATVDTNNASLAKTLGAVTSSATATVDISAALAKTLGNATLSATLEAAAQSADFSLAKTLANATSSASATVDVDAALSKTLGAVTSSSAATVTIDAALAKTLGALTSSATATVAVDAALSKTLGALTVVSAASVSDDATLTKTLGALTASATATVAVDASLTKTLGAATLAATATVDDSAALSKTLANATTSAQATVDVTASLTKTLGNATLVSDLTAASAGEFSLTKTLANATLVAPATVDVTASLAKTLANATLASTATVDDSATLSKTLGTVTASAQATVDVAASLAKTLGSVTLAGTLATANAGELALSKTLGDATASAQATVDVSAAMSRTLADATAFATATVGSLIDAVAPPTGMGPGWGVFGHHHPTYTKRKKRVEDTEQDLIRAYEDATGITAERERIAAIQELKRAAATALSVAKREDDAELQRVSREIIALKKFELTATAYLNRVGEILAQLQAQEADDMEALEMIARLV